MIPEVVSRLRSRLVKNPAHSGPCEIFYYEVDDYLTRDEKLNLLEHYDQIPAVPWLRIQPNPAHDWIRQRDESFRSLIPLGDKKSPESTQIFSVYSSGVKTNRDLWAINFSRDGVEQNMRKTIDFYNQQIRDYAAKGEQSIQYDDRRIKWDSDVRSHARWQTSSHNRWRLDVQ